jgi:hypothetical protein
MTPHQQRMRELEALRRVVAGCEPYLNAGTAPAKEVAAVFEGAASLLAGESDLRSQLQGLGKRLRSDPSGVVVGSRLRDVVLKLRQKADRLGKQLEARDARLQERT